MTEQDETKELIKRIKSLENKIVKLEKESRIGVEDQLFFGVIISLVVFVLELPIDEVISLFQTAGLSLDTASTIALGVRNVTLLFLIAASAARYYGAASGKMKSMRYRLFSLQCLIMAWNFVIFLFTVNASSDTSLNLGPISLLVTVIILFISFLLMMHLEKKILGFYASRELIFKKDVEPNVSKAFLLILAGLCFAIAIEFFVVVFLGWIFSSERFFTVWILTPVVVVLLKAIAERKRKSRKREEE